MLPKSFGHSISLSRLSSSTLVPIRAIMLEVAAILRLCDAQQLVPVLVRGTLSLDKEAD